MLTMNCRIPLIPMTSNGKDSRRLPVCLRQPAGSTNRKRRPAQAAAAAYLAKTYLYKAYRQDGADNALTGINEEDLKQVVKYTDPLIMAKGGYGLETDYSMNFLPQYENGAESVWAIQYSINDGTYKR